MTEDRDARMDAEDEQEKATIRTPINTPLVADEMTERSARPVWCDDDEMTAYRLLKRLIENLLLVAAM
jgi:hypothetical protein